MAIKVTQTVGRPLKELTPIRDWAVAVGNWVAAYMEKNNRIASGESIKSLEVEVVKVNQVILKGAPSVKFALGGRKSGKFPNVGAIKQWILDKPIQLVDITLNSLAFLIGRKIANSGTSEPKLRKQNIALVIKQLGKKYLKDVSSIQALEAQKLMIDLLTKSPNTTVKK